MRITDLYSLQNNVSFIRYKGKVEHTDNIQKVYICQPVNYIDEGIKQTDIWSGYIWYITNDITRNTGHYVFMLDKENDETYKQKIAKNNIYLKLCPMGINTSLAYINSESNCNKFPNLVRETITLTDNYKGLFTSKDEAEQYIEDIKNDIIHIPAKEHIVTMITEKRHSDGTIEKEEKQYRFPIKK